MEDTTNGSEPSWLTINAGGNIQGDPSGAPIGLNSWVIIATDPSVATGTATLNMTVVP